MVGIPTLGRYVLLKICVAGVPDSTSAILNLMTEHSFHHDPIVRRGAFTLPCRGGIANPLLFFYVSFCQGHR
ncbi:hypothetical protein SCFA_1420002 [anaerobic digester metagenome]|uniref:Uncharacterized protein n=1 Tax=anaerobic digester metagenome TaxID=1263854 RepID=A0A485LYQ7_9ZZZZ